MQAVTPVTPREAGGLPHPSRSLRSQPAVGSSPPPGELVGGEASRRTQSERVRISRRTEPGSASASGPSSLLLGQGALEVPGLRAQVAPRLRAGAGVGESARQPERSS